MTALDEGVYAIFTDGETCCVMSGEVVWFRLPGAATRRLQAGFYSLDMEYIGTEVDGVIMQGKLT